MSKVRASQIGHLADNPTLKPYGVGDKAGVRAWITVISNVRRTDQATGEISEKATRISWTVFGTTAENAAKYLRTGSKVSIHGRVETDEYKKDGEPVYPINFICEELEYLDSKETSELRAARRAEHQAEEFPG